MSDTVDTVAQARGNTSTRARGWCITVNNYDAQVYNTLIDYCKQNTHQYIVGKEVGEQGTPHLQGYLYFKNAVSFNTIKSICPTAHVEKAKGKPQANFEYCSKEGDFVTNMNVDESKSEYDDMLQNLYGNVVWKPWQKKILDMIDGPIDGRSINWYWEPTGNIGKTFLCKYICLKYNAIIASGKQNDVFNQVLEWVKKNGRRPQVIIIDVPRSTTEFINYGCIEAVKNGLLYSGKYEGGVCIFYPPHVVVFANEGPQLHKMSSDRWAVTDLSNASEAERLP